LQTLCVLSYTYRRRASSKANVAGISRVEQAPNVYEMSSDDTSQPVYANIQSGASAPASAPRSNLHDDTTLIDNDLYTGSVEQHPTTGSNAPDPPVYAVVNKNQSEASAPAGDTADNGKAQPSAPPARPRLYQDLTLIDNDLYR